MAAKENRGLVEEVLIKEAGCFFANQPASFLFI